MSRRDRENERGDRPRRAPRPPRCPPRGGDRKSTRLNSSHVATSYAVFCLKKKNYRRFFPAGNATGSVSVSPSVSIGTLTTLGYPPSCLDESLQAHYSQTLRFRPLFATSSN